MTDVDEMGPIDYLVVEFPNDREPDGSALGILRQLVEGGVIQVLDLAFVQGGGRRVDRRHQHRRCRSGRHRHHPVRRSAGQVSSTTRISPKPASPEPGHTAAVLVYENAWAARSRRPCDGPAPRWWRTAVSRSRPSSLPSTALDTAS